MGNPAIEEDSKKPSWKQSGTTTVTPATKPLKKQPTEMLSFSQNKFSAPAQTSDAVSLHSGGKEQ